MNDFDEEFTTTLLEPQQPWIERERREREGDGDEEGRLLVTARFIIAPNKNTKVIYMCGWKVPWEIRTIRLFKVVYPGSLFGVSIFFFSGFRGFIIHSLLQVPLHGDSRGWMLYNVASLLTIILFFVFSLFSFSHPLKWKWKASQCIPQQRSCVQLVSWFVG